MIEAMGWIEWKSAKVLYVVFLCVANFYLIDFLETDSLAFSLAAYRTRVILYAWYNAAEVKHTPRKCMKSLRGNRREEFVLQFERKLSSKLSQYHYHGRGREKKAMLALIKSYFYHCPQNVAAPDSEDVVAIDGLKLRSQNIVTRLLLQQYAACFHEIF